MVPQRSHTNASRRTSQRRGVITVKMIVALPSLVIMVGIVLEIGSIWLARIELENALESAAIAGVKVWSEQSKNNTIDPLSGPYNGLPHANPDLPFILAATRTATQQAFAVNVIRGTAYALNSNNYGGPAIPGMNFHGNDLKTGNIVLGGFDNTLATGVLTTSAVVGCGRDDSLVPPLLNVDFAVVAQKQIDVPSLFGNLFGISVPTYSISARATATARCQEGVDGVPSSTTDPDILTPRLVHVTDIP
jgi:Flp pilus assembly protein TadG